MQATKRYIKDASNNMERALNTMPPVTTAKGNPLPTTIQEITPYVDELFTAEERGVRDRATD